MLWSIKGIRYNTYHKKTHFLVCDKEDPSLHDQLQRLFRNGGLRDRNGSMRFSFSYASLDTPKCNCWAADPF